MSRYQIHAVADENCDSVNPDSLIGETDDLAEAQRMAAQADYPYGAAITDTVTGQIDFGAGFGVEVDYPYGAENMTPSELRTARLALGLSQQELADALGVSRETVARWESGRREIPPLLDARAAVTVLRLQDALA